MKYIEIRAHVGEKTYPTLVADVADEAEESDLRDLFDIFNCRLEIAKTWQTYQGKLVPVTRWDYYLDCDN